MDIKTEMDDFIEGEKYHVRNVSFAAEADSQEQLEFENRESDKNRQKIFGSDLHLYQCGLFVFTQIGYMAVVPSMLSTTFFEPSANFCEQMTTQQNQTYANISLTTDLYAPTSFAKDEFHSLLMERDQHCRSSHWTVWLSTGLMVGAIFGSFIAGFIADLFGRKPVVVVSMFTICLGNSLLVLFGSRAHYVMMIFIFFTIGTACGGYLVTNMVLLLEILRNSNTRLLVVSLNGWPLGMIGTAIMAYSLLHWRTYHIAVAAISLLFSIIMKFLTFESILWLVQSGRDQEAQNIHRRLIGINSLLTLIKYGEENGAKNSNESFVILLRSSKSASTIDDRNSNGTVYTYLDLFRYRSICTRILTLLFCFGSSSIISFGLYFSAEILPGSRYINIAIMGVSKLSLGFLPFILSKFMGRRPILLISIGFCMTAAWALIVLKLFFSFDKHLIITALGLFMTGAIDPNWKIIHLLSIELFPTPVRNMARALCNVVARLGSLSGPLVLFLRTHNEIFPFWLFAVLLSIQFIVSMCFLPETSGQPLPDRMPTAANDIVEFTTHQFRPRKGTRNSIRSAHSVDFAIA